MSNLNIVVNLESKNFEVGTIQKQLSANGLRILRYNVDMWHHDLKAHKRISAPEIEILKTKIEQQLLL